MRHPVYLQLVRFRDGRHATLKFACMLMSVHYWSSQLSYETRSHFKRHNPFLTILPMAEHHSGMENLSVLVLDDDATSLLLISSRLEELNFKVFPFQTEHAALDFLKKGTAKEEELDLILAEVHVSTMASRTLANSQLLSHIMNELHVPFVSMCAKDDEEAISECMAIGACFHLPKPLTTGSFNMLRHTARQHKSRRATPEGSNSRYKTVLSSTEMPKETLNLQGKELRHHESEKPEETEVFEPRGRSNKPYQLRWKTRGHSKKQRLIWTVELHEKFLEAIEVLGDKYAVPRTILEQMNVKDLTVKHIASHLQKHRLRQPKANQYGKFQQNANNKPVSLLVSSVHTASSSTSAESMVDIWEDHKRLLIDFKKTPAEAAASEPYSYWCTSGIFRDDTESLWDRYQKSLENGFSLSSRRQRYEQSAAKSKDVARDAGVSIEGPKTAGEMGYGAPFESSGSNIVLTSPLGQTKKNNLTETASNNDNVGNTAVMEPSDGWLHRQGNDALVYDRNKSSWAQMYLTSSADNSEEMNSFWMSQMEGPQGQLNVRPEDLLQVDEAWKEALVLGTQPNMVNVVPPMTQDATVGVTPAPDTEMQFAQTQETAAGDAPVSDAAMQFAQTQEAADIDAPVLDHVTQFAQDDAYWSLSPLVGDYDMLWSF